MSREQFIILTVWVGRLFSAAFVVLFLGTTADMVRDFSRQISERNFQDTLMCGGVLLAQAAGLMLAAGAAYLLWMVLP